MTPLHSILDLARWAPSGDNTQPWRFRVDEPDRISVFARDTRATCVYDLDGRSSQIAVGALLETIDLAATRFGLVATMQRRESPDESPVFEYQFATVPGLLEDPLVGEITRRRVQRRALGLRALSAEECALLAKAVGPDHELRWFAGWGGRARIADITFRTGQLRLSLPEAYPVHRDVIEWGATTSDDRIPDAALGATSMSLAVMRWAMTSWPRISLLNRYFAGSLLPGVELDLVPGLACAAHCILLALRPPNDFDDYVAAGRALQRFWLTASSLGLQFQPEYTPLVFARYSRDGTRFTQHSRSLTRSERLATRFRAVVGKADAERVVFMGRIGAGRPAAARSKRLPLERLLSPGP